MRRGSIVRACGQFRTDGARERRRLCPLFGEAARRMKARAMHTARGWRQFVRWRPGTAALVIGAALLARPALAADTGSAVAPVPVKAATCGGAAHFRTVLDVGHTAEVP